MPGEGGAEPPTTQKHDALFLSFVKLPVLARTSGMIPLNPAPYQNRLSIKPITSEKIKAIKPDDWFLT